MDRPISLYQNLYDSTVQRNAKERTREKRNWRMYDGADNGQWDEKTLAILLQEGRPTSTFNLIKQKIDQLVGSILADGLETHFDTELGDSTDAALLLNEHFLEDKDLGNWKDAHLQFVRAGFVYRGIKEIFIDRTHDPRGRVDFRYVPGDRIHFDPDWVTKSVNDNKHIFVSTWMTPAEIQRRWKRKSPELSAAIALWEQTRESQTTEVNQEKRFDRSPEWYDAANGRFLVIQCFELRYKDSTQIFDPINGEWLPEKDQEEAELLRMTAELEGRPLDFLPKTKRVVWVTTCAPGLSLNLKLDDAPHELQIGRYPFFVFSSDNINGHISTYVDMLEGAQTTFNKREASITHMMMTNVNNAWSVEEDAFEDETGYNDFVKRKNKPGASFRVTSGANSQNKIKALEKQTVPTDFFNAPAQMKEIADFLTPAVPAVQGQGEKAGESGVLYQSKVAQARIGMAFIQAILEAEAHEEGEAYFAAFKQVYSGAPRALTSSRTKQVFVMNAPGGIDVASITRLRVTISRSPSSETFRRQLVQQYLALAPYIAKSPATAASMNRVLVKALPEIPEEEREKLAETAAMEETFAKLQLQLQIVTLQGQLQQAQMMQAQAAMAMQPQAQPQAPPGPAMQKLLSSLNEGQPNGQDVQDQPAPIPGQGGTPPSAGA